MGTPPLSALVVKRDGIADKSQCYQFIEIIILLLNEYFGAKWSDITIKDCAQSIYTDYYYLTIADLKLFMKKAKAVEFEKERKIFGEWKPSLLMAWIDIFSGEWEQSRAVHVGEHSHGLVKRQEEYSDQQTKANREISLSELHTKELAKFKNEKHEK